MTQLEGEPKDRYRAERRHRRGWAWEVRLVTTHVILEREAESRSDPATVWGERWACWKGRRMVAAAERRDVREGQPWIS